MGCIRTLYNSAAGCILRFDRIYGFHNKTDKKAVGFILDETSTPYFVTAQQQHIYLWSGGIAIKAVWFL